MTLLPLLLQGGNSQEDTSREILTSFFNTCNGISWDRNDNWLDDGASLCSWFGVTCDDDANIVEITLRSNELRCEIPEDVFYLSFLRYFDVSGNNDVFINFGAIDPDLAADLTGLYFADTLVDSLEGIETFSNLTALGAGGNALIGDFPSQVKQLTGLTTLDLSDNFLSGAFPDDIDVLSNLQILLISNNFLEGTLTRSIGNLKDLTQFLIQFNDLTGTLPDELTQLGSLTLLSLNDQTMEEGGGFTGPMLDFANAPFLLNVDVANNGLTGSVPGSLLESVNPEFANLINVDMSGNHFTGVVPADLSRFQAIRLYLSGNSIQGIDDNLCFQDGWFFGDVGEFGCDGILCPPGSFNVFGRQISAGFPCQTCSASSFFGATKCQALTSGARLHLEGPEASDIVAGYISSIIDEHITGDAEDNSSSAGGASLQDWFGSMNLEDADPTDQAIASHGMAGLDTNLDSSLNLRAAAEGLNKDMASSGAVDPMSVTILLLCCVFASPW